MGLFDKFKRHHSEKDLDIQNLFEQTASPQNILQPTFNQQSVTQPFQQSNLQPQPEQGLTQDIFSAPQIQTPTPTQQTLQPSYDYTNYSRNLYAEWENYIQAIAEKVVDDKIKEIEEKITELKIWKEKLELSLNKLSERVDNLEKKLDNTINLVLKKVEEYDKGIREATTETQALHRLIRTMVPAISESVKELRETINEIKQLRDSIKTP